MYGKFFKSCLILSLLVLFSGTSTILHAAEQNACIAQANTQISVQEKLAMVEECAEGRLGVVAIDTSNGKLIQYRGDERFPFCSTFKVMLVGAVLKRSMSDSLFLQRNVFYKKKDLVSWSPITEKQLGAGMMSVSALCAASLQYSDNTATNLLIKEMGGVKAVNAFARSIGDNDFSLNRLEPELNSAIPLDKQDTTTPLAMAKSLELLALGAGDNSFAALGQAERKQLQEWLKGNTTGAASIKAGLPSDWIVGDKTGSGSYGTTNDIAVIWPPDGAPLVIVTYFAQTNKDAEARRDVLAVAAKLLVDELR